jgi:hypothetical protein
MSIWDNYECDGQMSLEDYKLSLLDRTYDRHGRQSEAPSWMNRERCENCKWWELLLVEEQPPDGWGVKGQCNLFRDGQTHYEQPCSTSYCDDFRYKIEMKGEF